MNRCPRCGGNLLADILEGMSCLQCGYVPRPDEKEVLAMVAGRNKFGGLKGTPHAYKYVRPNGGVGTRHKALQSSPWRGVRR